MSGQSKEEPSLFLNPYKDAAFTRCPKCESKTKIRKFPLVIHAEPKQLLLLNKSCRYCMNCDLIIARQEELEAVMAASLSQANPEIVGNEYLVVGTMDKKDWRASVQGKIGQHETFERIHYFEDVLNIEVIPGGWYPSEKE